MQARTMWVVCAALVATGGLAASVPAQERENAAPQEPAVVRGEVRSQERNEPVADAEVLLDGSLIGRADEKGRFQFRTSAGTHIMEIRRIGFANAVARLELEAGADLHLVIELPERVAQLDTIVIEGRNLPYAAKLAGFYDRRDNWRFGQFFGPEQLEKITLSNMRDLFHRVSGVDVTCVDPYCTAYTLQPVGRTGGVMSGRVRCPMEYYVDGIRWNPGLMGIDVLNPEAVAAVEVYAVPAHVPPQLGGARAQCGVVAFWLKTAR